MTGLRMAMVLAVLGGTPAEADVWDYGQDDCNQLWFMRNLIMDRAGYCFGSALGQALFDNGDCAGTDIRLGTEQSRQVGRIQALEAEIGCTVNTSRRSLDVHGIAALSRLRDMPLPDNGESACIGWKGQPVTLYDGYGAKARAIGQIEPGDTLGSGFIPVGDWVVVTVAKGGDWDRVIYGWYDGTELDWSKGCTDIAG